MKAFMSYRSAVIGLAALALVFSVSCGKKSGGSTATPPTTNPTTGDCSSSTSKCTLGQKYSSGVYLGSGFGENAYGYDKNLSLYLGFFAKDTTGVTKQNNYVTYGGDVVANGSMKITKGAYGFLTNPNPSRMVSALTFDFSWDFGYGYNTGTPNYGYDTGYNSGYNNGYSQCPNANTCNTCYTGTCNNYQQSECELPEGSYTVSTTTAGQWDEYYYLSPDITNLQLKITGSKYTVAASFNGYLDTSSGSSGTLYGNLVFKTVNGKTCNLPVAF